MPHDRRLFLTGKSALPAVSVRIRSTQREFLGWVLAFCEPAAVERGLQLWVLALFTLSTGAIGMLLARRRPILSSLFISIVFLSAFAVYLEVRDSYAGDSVLTIIGYVSGSALAILSGIGMSAFGAFVGAKKVDKHMGAWRWTSGASGTLLLGLALYATTAFARNVYRMYFDPRIRTINHHFIPMRWQDILPELPTACVLMALLFFATYLLCSAFQDKTTGRIAVNS